eukprot:805000-Karenia_brevis.AAC.1
MVLGKWRHFSLVAGSTRSGDFTTWAVVRRSGGPGLFKAMANVAAPLHLQEWHFPIDLSTP